MSIENQSNMMQWIATSERLPEIDTTDIWNNDNKISKDVLCYSSKWGITFGRFHVAGGFWTLNGITSSDTIIVEYWMDVIPPKKTKKILKAKKH